MGSRNNEQREEQHKAGGSEPVQETVALGWRGLLCGQRPAPIGLCEPGSESGIYSKGDGSHGGDLDRERHGLVGCLSITLM